MSISERRKNSPKRLAVVEAATNEFLNNGFAETSMDRIAESANVSKRTVYDHFPSKDDLFQAIIDTLLAKVDEMPAHEYDQEASLEQQMLTIGYTFARTITRPEFMKFSRVVISRFIQAPEWAHNTNKAYDRLRHDMTTLFRVAQKDGRLQIADLGLAVTQFCGLIKENVFWPQLMAGQKSSSESELKSVVKSAVAMILDHYGVPQSSGSVKQRSD